MIKKAISCFLFLSLASCQSSEPTLNQFTFLADHEVIEGSTATQTTHPLIRTRLIFRDRLTGINSAEHYRLELRFPQDGSHTILQSHFSSFSKRDGVELKLARSGLDLKAFISSPDRTEFALGTYPNLFVHSDLHRFRVEVHDGVANGVRLIAWVEDASPEAPRRIGLESITIETAWLDSDEKGFFSSTHGRGIRWGLETQGVLVKAAHREAPFVR